MLNAENYHEAWEEKKDVEITFARCFQAYDKCYQFASDPKVKSDALNACHSLITGKKEFDKRFEECQEMEHQIAEIKIEAPDCFIDCRRGNGES